MKYILITTIILFFSTNIILADGEENTEKIENANKFYSNAEYKEAIKLYEEVLNNGVEAFELYYNLGNAYYKNNNLGYAILNYERAKLLSPNDDKNNHNIEFANQYIKDKLNKIPEFFLSKFFKQMIYSKSSNFWAFLTIFSFIVGLGSVIIFLFEQEKLYKKISFIASIILFVVAINSFVFSYKTKKNTVGENNAIVVETAIVKSSPGNEGTELFILNEGVKIALKGKSSDWYEIKLEDGSIGWLHNKYFEII